ncbi:cytochrome c biogenesis protein ResB [Luteolibacter yonseiensis]|uniref:Cytochrome c biogenesis protein ResB n=1 Tax=Luteolibacter yonseiensis TaxID=1144680 RepID=A0A934R9M0_9BACT|nr:cytochrome c biogenesis protein ResB [Luteolibacter yonseiensis]MBK1817720.1 cytochrome c biogenesis protein ResB [Luteolibacter yonseiensis]
MEITETPPPNKASRSLPGKIFDVLSGFGLATITLLLLALLTWFATLEQVEHGLYVTLNKYFATDWKSIFILPELNGKMVPLPLPGGYWMCAVLLVNLILGGVVRIRKGWKHVGNLIAHFGIIFMLIGAGVTYHFSERGNMVIWQEGQNSVAEDYYEHVVEITEIKDGGAAKIHVIRGKDLTDLEQDKRLFRLPELPFDIELGGYQANVVPISAGERAPDRNQQVFDGYYLAEKPKLAKPEEAENYTPGVLANIVNRDGTKVPPFILAAASYKPFTYQREGRIFTIDIHKRLWPMPFTLRLDEFTADFHPGTMMASKFISKVTRLENGGEAKVTIQMNEPMRYEGLTFFQAGYGPRDAKPGDKMYSSFEVVRNPADQWPVYSLWIVAIGMAVTFVMKFVSFLSGGSRKKSHV